MPEPPATYREPPDPDVAAGPEGSGPPEAPAACPLNGACAALAGDDQVARLHRALGAAPDAPGLHTDLGVLLTRRGRLDAALAHLRRALELTPDAPGAHNNLGIALARRGDLEGAAEHYRHALRLRPDFAQAHYNLGNVLRRLGRRDEAGRHYEQALRYKPHDFETRRRLGDLRLEQERLADAVTHLRAARRLRPKSVEVLNQLGVALTKLGQAGEAVALFDEALRLRPGAAGIHNNAGIALARLGRFAEAVARYREALRLDPGAPGALGNLANALRDHGHLDEALLYYEEALRVAPDAADTHNNKAIAHVKLRHLDRARAHYEAALVRQPDFAEARLNRAHLYLLEGDFARGWPEYEWRWRLKDAQPFRCRQPPWDGSPLAGRTILLHWEQGYGDVLQFVRYAPLVKAQGGTVLLSCPPRLYDLLGRCRGIDRLLRHGDPLPDFDVHAPLASLPGLLGTALDTVPAEVPYLFADPALVGRWRRELPAEAPLKVGIAWQGNPKYGGDRHRSIPLAYFLPLARLPGVQLYSLQKGPGREQLQALPADTPILDLGGRLDERTGAFVDTAAVMQCLDLVLTSDTAVPHLAGGLGVPVWVVLNFSSDWRWLLEREDSPWYPTMRLFRQRRFGDWAEVFERVAAELARLSARRRVERLQAPTTPGDLLDRITGLMVEMEWAEESGPRRLRSEVEVLVRLLDQAVPVSAELTQLSHELRAANQARRQAEEELRRCAVRAEGGGECATWARRLGEADDRRAALKRRIDMLARGGDEPGKPVSGTPG